MIDKDFKLKICKYMIINAWDWQLVNKTISQFKNFIEENEKITKEGQEIIEFIHKVDELITFQKKSVDFTPILRYFNRVS